MLPLTPQRKVVGVESRPKAERSRRRRRIASEQRTRAQKMSSGMDIFYKYMYSRAVYGSGHLLLIRA